VGDLAPVRGPPGNPPEEGARPPAAARRESAYSRAAELPRCEMCEPGPQRQPEGVARDPASRPDRGEASVPQNAPTRRPAVT
jgi:hypothetical protein